ncbi:crispr-associated integrase [Leptolyngbya sp. Heron Island J]|nr:crispr-associated integrase [Leptolyngbya sp. Heron Island J]
MVWTMAYNSEIHHRRSIRLKNYDYRQSGAYFITICVQNRECLFGGIENRHMMLNQYGNAVTQIWQQVPHHFSNVEIDAAIVMPNHFHGILILQNPSTVAPSAPDTTSSATGSKVKNPTLGQVVAYFKYQSTKHINNMRSACGIKVWQRNYYENIIRNEASLARIRAYIATNPEKWIADQLHSNCLSKW